MNAVDECVVFRPEPHPVTLPLGPEGGSGARRGVAAANLGLRPVVEMAPLASLGYLGVSLDGPVALRAALAVTAPMVAWARHMAPRTPGRLIGSRALVVELSIFAIGDVTHRALHDPGDRSPLPTLLQENRAHAWSQPNPYRLATSGPLDRQRLPEGLEEWAANPRSVVTGDRPLAQALRSMAHGTVIPELEDRYRPDSGLDRTWRAGVSAFERAVAANETGCIGHPPAAGASCGVQMNRPVAPPPGPRCRQCEAIQERRRSWPPPIRRATWNFPVRTMRAS